MWTPFLIAAAVVYLGFLLLLYTTQRRIVFRPDPTAADLAAAGLAEQMIEVAIKTGDGLTLTSWWAPPVRPDRRVIVYLHGNAGHRGGRADRIRDYLGAGYGVLLVGYRGYGGNPGAPTEEIKQGIYPLPFAKAFDKAITIGTGQCPVKKYNLFLRDLTIAGRAKPSFIVSHRLPLEEAPDAYDKFDRRTEGYTKVILKPSGGARA